MICFVSKGTDSLLQMMHPRREEEVAETLSRLKRSAVANNSHHDAGCPGRDWVELGQQPLKLTGHGYRTRLDRNGSISHDFRDC